MSRPAKMRGPVGLIFRQTRDRLTILHIANGSADRILDTTIELFGVRQRTRLPKSVDQHIHWGFSWYQMHARREETAPFQAFSKFVEKVFHAEGGIKSQPEVLKIVREELISLLGRVTQIDFYATPELVMPVLHNALRFFIDPIDAEQGKKFTDAIDAKLNMTDDRNLVKNPNRPSGRWSSEHRYVSELISHYEPLWRTALFGELRPEIFTAKYDDMLRTLKITFPNDTQQVLTDKRKELFGHSMMYSDREISELEDIIGRHIAGTAAGSTLLAQVAKPELRK